MENENTSQYTVSISPVLHTKIEEHIYLLKKLLKPDHTKNKWVNEAIQEKLSREKAKKDIVRDKHVRVFIDLLTKRKLEERVQMIRSLRYSYSKKQWILDAIEEKLSHEEDSIKIKLKEYHEAINCK